MSNNADVIELLTQTKESLERELYAFRDGIRDEMRAGFQAINERFDSQAERMDRDVE